MAGGKETRDRIQEAKEKEATELNLSGMGLTAVPPEIGHLTNLQELALHENPLSSPPPEVIAQGTAAIVAYLRSALEQGQREWVSKLLVVGEGGVGNCRSSNLLPACNDSARECVLRWRPLGEQPISCCTHRSASHSRNV